MRIELLALDLPEQKITERIKDYVELREFTFVWECEFYADEPVKNEDGETDKLLPWENIKTYFYAEILKDKITGTELFWDTESKKFQATIHAMDFSAKFFFRTSTAGHDFLDKVKGWLYAHH